MKIRMYKIFKDNVDMGYAKSLEGAIETIIAHCNSFGLDVKLYKVTDHDDTSIVFWRGEKSDEIDYHDELSV
jgi:hypothetical protein